VFLSGLDNFYLAVRIAQRTILIRVLQKRDPESRDWDENKEPSIKDVRSQGGGVDQGRRFADKGEIQLFGAKIFRFFEI